MVLTHVHVSMCVLCVRVDERVFVCLCVCMMYAVFGDDVLQVCDEEASVERVRGNLILISDARLQRILQHLMVGLPRETR